MAPDAQRKRGHLALYAILESEKGLGSLSQAGEQKRGRTDEAQRSREETGCGGQRSPCFALAWLAGTDDVVIRSGDYRRAGFAGNPDRYNPVVSHRRFIRGCTLSPVC